MRSCRGRRRSRGRLVCRLPSGWMDGLIDGRWALQCCLSVGDFYHRLAPLRPRGRKGRRPTLQRSSGLKLCRDDLWWTWIVIEGLTGRDAGDGRGELGADSLVGLVMRTVDA